MKQFLLQLALKERCPNTFVLSVCAGVFIGLSPFMGLHTVMIFAFVWLFRLNLPVTFAVAYLNNPWTVGPLLCVEYAIGRLIVSFFGLAGYLHNPQWVSSCNSLLSYYTGLPTICFWTFIIGASALTIIGTLLLYPLLHYVCSTFIFPHVRLLRKNNREAYN